MGTQRYNMNLADTGKYNAAVEREQNYIGKKIAEARKDKKLSLAAFSDLLSKHGLAIQRQGLGKWESGDAIPNAYQLLAVCHALEIQDGVAYFTETPAKVEALNKEGLRKLQDYKEDLIASGRYSPQPVRKSNIIYINKPVSLLPASAGPGAFLDEENFEMVSFPENSIPANADFGVRVSGDSMEPVYHDGQIVWVQRCNELAPGEVGLFLYDGDGYIKVYDEQEPDELVQENFVDTNGVLHMQPVLISYNKNYEPKLISPQLSFSIAGRILN